MRPVSSQVGDDVGVGEPLRRPADAVRDRQVGHRAAGPPAAGGQQVAVGLDQDQPSQIRPGPLIKQRIDGEVCKLPADYLGWPRSS